MKRALTALLLCSTLSAFSQTEIDQEKMTKIDAEVAIINEKMNCCSNSRPFKVQVNSNGDLKWMDGYIKFQVNLLKLFDFGKANAPENKFGTYELLEFKNGIGLVKSGWSESPKYTIRFNKNKKQEEAKRFNEFDKQEDAEEVYNAVVKIYELLTE